MSGQTSKIIAVTIWIVFFTVIGLTFYVNHYMPHGPMYSTGDIVCENDGRGPCGEALVEDMRDLDIPDWAKFLRQHFVLILLTLGIAGLYFGSQANKGRRTYE